MSIILIFFHNNDKILMHTSFLFGVTFLNYVLVTIVSGLISGKLSMAGKVKNCNYALCLLLVS